MKSLSIKNLKNLREHGVVLKGNYGVTALRNPNSMSITIIIPERYYETEGECINYLKEWKSINIDDKGEMTFEMNKLTGQFAIRDLSEDKKILSWYICTRMMK